MKSNLLEAMNWRYAVKRFDPSKKISEENFSMLMESLRLSPSSYGLQPIKVLNIESPELRQRIKSIAWNQQQVIDASHLLVFCHVVNPGKLEIEQHIERMVATRKNSFTFYEGFKNQVTHALQEMSNSEREAWTAKQSYIALGQLLLACAYERIDATPMEGFDAQELGELLKLTRQGFKASLLCPIGYRHPEDPVIALKKVRKSSEDFYQTI